MNRKIFCFIILFSAQGYLFGQKASRLYDSLSLENMGGIDMTVSPSVSEDGSCVFYSFYDDTLKSSILTIQLTSSFEMNTFPNATSASFISNSPLVFFKKGIDSLCLWDYNKKILRTIDSIADFKISHLQSESWLAYRKILNDSILFLVKIANDRFGLPIELFNVRTYKFNNTACELFLENKKGTYIFSIYSLKDYSISQFAQRIRNNEIVKNIAFSSLGDNVAFTTEAVDSLSVHFTLWCTLRKKNISIRITNQDIKNVLAVDYEPEFSKNGRFLLFRVKEDIKKINIGFKGVDVWHYRDAQLQPEQLANLNRKSIFYVSLDLASNLPKPIYIESSTVNMITRSNSITGNYVVCKVNNNIKEYWWKYAKQPEYCLFSLLTGNLTTVSSNRFGLYAFSPSGNYILCYNSLTCEYYSIDLRNMSKNAISGDQKFNFKSYNLLGRLPTKEKPLVGFAGWIRKSDKAIVYNMNDIWILDLTGKSSPLRITKNDKNNIRIRYRISSGSDPKLMEYSEDSIILLTAYDIISKKNGLFYIKLRENSEPKKIDFGPYRFYIVSSQLEQSDTGEGCIEPIKAKFANVFLFSRQSSIQPSNLFICRDFNKIYQLTNFNRTKEYRSCVSELISWEDNFGVHRKALVYKPDDFDAKKKYPTIFVYYENRSDELYKFNKPFWTINDLNIPWFVNRGYVIVVPDVLFYVGNPGLSALKSVNSVKKELIKYKWFNEKQVGLYGHSFGGYETNYIVTHSNSYSAAVGSSGPSDLISEYNSVAGEGFFEGNSLQLGYEIGQMRIGGTLWEKKRMFLENSPVLSADRVTTPVLLMHNKNDGIVNWTQGIEFIMSLRRLEKSSWMLQYDQGSHSLSGIDAIDYTNRLRLFFDHFLKTAPAPIWMTRGIPARLKGIENGYEYDPAGSCGKDCKVCKSWNEKMSKDSVATWKEIERRKVEEHWE